LLLLEARAARDLIAKIHELKPFDVARGPSTIDATDASMPRRDSLLEGIAVGIPQVPCVPLEAHKMTSESASLDSLSGWPCPLGERPLRHPPSSR
jgi:hypothetical protein